MSTDRDQPLDLSQRLRSEAYRSRDLVACYAPPSLASVMPGNAVMLRSGGPRMYVTEAPPGGDRCTVALVDGEGRLVLAEFELAMLTCWGAS